MKANKGTKIYCPEMGEKKPIAEIYATLSRSGKYRLSTPLELKGRGITYYETYSEENCLNPFKYGWHVYYVTENAYRKLEKQYAIARESLLD